MRRSKEPRRLTHQFVQNLLRLPDFLNIPPSVDFVCFHVCVSVISDRVAFILHSANDIGMCGGMRPNNEERGSNFFPRQQVQQAWSMLWMRSVIKSDARRATLALTRYDKA